MFEQHSGPCAVAGREAELTALLASLSPGLPGTTLHGAAEQLRDLVQAIASAPALGPVPDEAAWAAQRQGESFSLFGPDVLITATIGSLDVRGIHVNNEHGADWQFDFAGAMSGAASASDTPAPSLRIRAYQDFQLVADHVFEADGRVTDGRDWSSRLREGEQEIQRALSQMPSSEALEGGQVPDRPRPEFADPPRSAGGLSAGGDLGAGLGLGQALGGVGRMAAGMAVAAAAGMAVAAVGGVAAVGMRREETGGKAPAPPSSAPLPPPYAESTIEGHLPPSWKIRVLAGMAAGSVFPLKPQMTLGRGNDNDIQILDPEISRNHMRFDVRDDCVVVTDLGSSRGTKVDGAKIDRPMPLRVGQTVEAGHSKFIIEGSASPAHAPQLPTAPSTEAAIWYYADKNGQQGPVTEAVLRQRLATGLPPETLVWNSELDNWEPAHSLALCPAPKAAPVPAPAPKPLPAAAAAPVAAPVAIEWFFMEKGVRQGPVAEAVLRQRLATGLPVETMVWHNKLETWKPAHAVGLCDPVPAAAKPAPVQAPAVVPAPVREVPIWYFMEQGARQGPVTESVLRQRLATGLAPDTLVWHAKLDNWKTAHEVGLCAAPVRPPAATPAPAAATPEWYFMDHGVRQGPVAEALLRQRLARGLPPDTLVWHAKLDNWKPADSLGLCGAAAVAPAPAIQPQVAGPAAQSKKCPKCGRALSAQHRFCAGCGTPV